MRKLLAASFLLTTLSTAAQSGVAISIRSGAFDPGTCTLTGRNVFFNRTSAVLKVCTAANTWSSLTIGGITQADADLRYFKLAADNDPITGTTQFDLNVGIGVAPSANAGDRLLVQRDATEGTRVRVRNADATDTGSLANLRAEASTAVVNTAAYGAAYNGTRNGTSLANFSELLLSAGSGLNVGASGSATVRFFTNDTFRMTIASSGNVSLDGLAVTAGTMTGTYEAVLSMATTCRPWTNAQVVALGATTAGDIAWGTLPAKYIVRNAYIVITGAAAGPATVTVSLGRTSASYIDYIVASDAKAAANTVYGDASAERGTNLTGYDLPSYTATTLINAHFVSTGANLSTVTASTGTVCVTLDKLP